MSTTLQTLQGPLHTPLCDLLGCRYPIVQTAMGWVADARLVAATANAGGFGFLAGATLEPEQVEAEILKVKSLTDKPFGINFHMFQKNAQQVVELAIRHRLRAVSYGRGPDAKTIRRFKDAGIVCMPTVGAPKHAVKAVELGADIVTVQGAEGGGHTGSVPTTLLLPKVLDAVRVPVVAAGGFFDGRGLAAALAYGAAGIAMGTRFLMSAESPVPRETLERYVAVGDPARIRVSDALDGLPQRMIDNSYLLKLERFGPLRRTLFALKTADAWRRQNGLSTGDMLGLAIKALRSHDYTASQTLMAANAPFLIQRAIVEGRPDEGVLPSGQAAAMIGAIEPCDALIARIVAEAGERLDALAALRGTAAAQAA
ncbi:nitronate monooxygenase [Burkholderia sp. LS-044]|uniref:NAD(P)H-dependent flavin oxidoreductase n=1 Tax=Burkholderia sp. LS-044 TaxID=1459967 RepID=UPI0010A644C9|nr:nitronate monooxygenase [Burkholderia sp. LS-044]THJ56318.1 nitronate monooxygenase [Burkholderia sp. LS-044]